MCADPLPQPERGHGPQRPREEKAGDREEKAGDREQKAGGRARRRRAATARHPAAAYTPSRGNRRSHVRV